MQFQPISESLPSGRAGAAPCSFHAGVYNCISPRTLSAQNLWASSAYQSRCLLLGSCARISHFRTQKRSLLSCELPTQKPHFFAKYRTPKNQDSHQKWFSSARRDGLHQSGGRLVARAGQDGGLLFGHHARASEPEVLAFFRFFWPAEPEKRRPEPGLLRFYWLCFVLFHPEKMWFLCVPCH